jgi:3-hydroxyisobutyrate dehydrogenase-like beta-hydroxyacid dehydrogenase
MSKVGFIGLGVMGGQMVSRLLSKGHTVTGYNRTRSKAQRLIDKGMKWEDSPRAVAAASDFTFAMVTNAAAISAITEGSDGMLAGLGPGKIRFHTSLSHAKLKLGRSLPHANRWPWPKSRPRACVSPTPIYSWR